MADFEDAFENPRFFVMLDRLYDILTVRLQKWRKSHQFKGLKKMMDRSGKKEIAALVERLTVAYDLSCALKYMHDLRYVTTTMIKNALNCVCVAWSWVSMAQYSTVRYGNVRQRSIPAWISRFVSSIFDVRLQCRLP